MRLIVVSFPDLSEDWHQFRADRNEMSAGAMGYREHNGSDILFVGCETDVTGDLRLADSKIVIPEEILSHMEEFLEAIVNRIAVLDGSKRKISSPLPSGALVPQDEPEREWLNDTDGIRSERSALQGFRYRIDASAQEHLEGRRDGVALLAEALSHDHPTGRFHELLRVFERAFSLSSTELASPLGRFLEGAGHGYTVDEATDWVVRLRHPATHADRRDDFVLERRIRPIIRRMEQAAYDTLFNKRDWRSPDHTRRDVWRVPCGTRSQDGADIFITRGEEMIMESQLIDDFGSYPIFLGGGIEEALPEEFWTEFTRSK